MSGLEPAGAEFSPHGDAMLSTSRAGHGTFDLQSLSAGCGVLSAVCCRLCASLVGHVQLHSEDVWVAFAGSVLSARSTSVNQEMKASSASMSDNPLPFEL